MKFIVCEGLDGGGKSSVIERVIESNPEFVYSRILGSKNLIGRMAVKFRSIFLSMIQLVYLSRLFIKPNLNNGKTIIQERYDASIFTFLPEADKWHNKLIIKFLKIFLIKPDGFVYFHVNMKERVRRLKMNDSGYHSILLRNPDIIRKREKAYLEFFNNFSGKKIKIDSGKNNIEKSARILSEFIKN